MNRRAKQRRFNRRRRRKKARCGSDSDSESSTSTTSVYQSEYSPYRPESDPPGILFVSATRLELNSNGLPYETMGRFQVYDQSLSADGVAEIATANANMAMADSGLRLGVPYGTVRKHAINDQALYHPHSTFMNVHTTALASAVAGTSTLNVHTTAGAGAGADMDSSTLNVHTSVGNDKDKLRAVAGLHVCQGPTGPSPYGFFYAVIVLSYARPDGEIVARREVSTIRMPPELGRRVRGYNGIRFVAQELSRLASKFGAESSCDCIKQISLRETESKPLRETESKPCPACDVEASIEELAAQADVARAVAKYAIVSDYTDWDDTCVQGLWSNSVDLSGIETGDTTTGISAVIAYYLYRPEQLPE